MNVKPIKVYELYPTVKGFSPKTDDYKGEIIAIVATSIKQAYYFAFNQVWVKNKKNPIGIIWTYNKRIAGPDHTFWDGTKCYGMCEPRHGEGKKAILAWMNQMGKE
jgi:hypothetical protein